MKNRPKVFIARRLPDEALHMIASSCDYEMWEQEDVPVPHGVLADAVRRVDGVLTMLTDSVPGDLLQSTSTLKVVANMAVGYDNVDVAAAKRLGITVTNTPDVLTETTADLTFALLLAAARRIVEAGHTLRNGQWSTWSPMFLTGMDVFGKTLGVIGMGRIGQAVTRRALGFNMTVHYYARTQKNGLPSNIHYMSLDDVLQTADFISVLTPLTQETRHLIGERELSLMKSTAVLINTARGPIVDEDALYQALVNKRIWAAALDVFDEEPVSPKHPLLELPNVVATPHIGSATIETRTKMAVLAAQNLVAALHGQTPQNRVV
ncbi:2-hydroxyacid dehydrogenase [Alicyclobacillus fastidiosus]|uniref:D-glycerate dehydrogenase n=1 Tax=Alicyclobacillus fastidiosus TaxID=392011 RepID=A0ABV5A9P9_9BACL|nr:D-glycerate dehydrogenase [Alicyclobacillus fastidiosus]WEH10744.1 D-glycerate dehydrogenase [Alicyclobacillus fastidiosus]